MIEGATCATLVNYSDASGVESVLRPEIAATMPAVSADGRTYTFDVRPGFRFSPPSGEAVTAETFRYSIERALSPKLGDDTPGPQFLGDVDGIEAFRDGTADHVDGLKVDGDQLSITLTAPSPDFLTRLALPFFCPVPVDTPFVSGAVGEQVRTDAGSSTRSRRPARTTWRTPTTGSTSSSNETRTTEAIDPTPTTRSHFARA